MTHITTGKQGEKIAALYLKQQGYKIICCNWKAGKKEIDIIAEENSILVFVEVKTRRSTNFGYPEQAVNLNKQSYLIEAATIYLETELKGKEFRFDVVSIVLNENEHRIFHFKDAFT